jgi:hypothetical protein
MTTVIQTLAEQFFAVYTCVFNDSIKTRTLLLVLQECLGRRWKEMEISTSSSDCFRFSSSSFKPYTFEAPFPITEISMAASTLLFQTIKHRLLRRQSMEMLPSLEEVYVQISWIASPA